MIGDWAYSVAVSVWVFQEHGAAALGLFGVARYVTMALIGPLMATAADRFPKRRVMVAADVVRAVIVVMAAIVIAVDGPAALVFASACSRRSSRWPSVRPRPRCSPAWRRNRSS